MLKVLIVDDELYAIRAIVKSVRFEQSGFDEVYTAAGANEAKRILQEHPIDLIICDIEMPGLNGLDFTEWVNGQYPEIWTIFLTGHAEFAYAQKAIQLASFEYLLKPVKVDQLEATLQRAADKIRQDREASRVVEANEKYRRMWESQKAVIVERFWQSLLAGRVAPAREDWQSVNVPMEPDAPVLPVLISIEQWRRDFSNRDEEIMEYALRNAAAELILDSKDGDIIKDSNGILFALAYGSKDKEIGRDRLADACRPFIEACNRYFYCSVSCYIGYEAPLARLNEVYHRLIELERDNVSATMSVQLLGDEQIRTAVKKRQPVAIPWSDWVVLFETGQRAELLKRLYALFDEWQQAHVDMESASALYHALQYMVYHVAHKNGLSVKDWAAPRDKSGEANVLRSLPQLKAWAEGWIDAASRYLDEQRQVSSATVHNVKQYILSHLKEATRENVAKYFYLNPAYLSRLFKKEAGQSIIDFIIHSRMDHAKILLTETHLKIVDICEEIGYENYSHFGQAFKKRVGISPQEYRKRYQQLR